MQVSSNSSVNDSVGAFATLLSKARIEKSLTRTETADRVGVAPAMIYDYEFGKAVPGSREWARYCNMVSRDLRRYDVEYRNAFNAFKKTGPLPTPAPSPKPPAFNPPKLVVVPEPKPEVAKPRYLKELFGPALTKAMADNKVIADDVASALEVTGSAVHKWAQGVTVPTDINMGKLIQLFGELDGWQVVAKKVNGPMGRKPKAATQEKLLAPPEAPATPVIPITVSPTEHEQAILLLLRRKKQSQEALAQAEAAMSEAEKAFQLAQENLATARKEAALVAEEVHKALNL